jgi:UDP-N-acetylmuramyl pentapeptide phosphotransferase/UDP-N-acetylglucosamine-1-phosphate transferase
LKETPRLGGLIIILCLSGYTWFSNDTESTLLAKMILLSMGPAMIFALKEDFLQNVEPTIRLLSLLFAGWFFQAQYVGPLPDLSGVTLISPLINIPGGTSFFYIFAIAAIANGMNLIDGVNGLCGAVALAILSALLFLAHRTGDVAMLPIISGLILLLLPFLIFNYPSGKIFLGDLGAYSLGLIVSILTVILYGRHPELNVWGAVLILIYPVTELIFTILRRILKGSSIFIPDRGHLHLKVFYFFRTQIVHKQIASTLVTPLLSILWLFPLMMILWVRHNFIFIMIAVTIFLIIYMSLYTAILNVQKIKK